MLAFYLSMITSEEGKHKFQIIYDKFGKMIYYMAHQMTTDNYMAEDIAQETFMKIVKNIETLRYDNDDEFRVLISLMTKHCAYNYLKKNSNDTISLEDLIIEPNKSYEKVIVDSIIVKDIMEEIEKLEIKYSVPLRLSINGYKANEIASLLDISPENVRIRIHRAKKMIAKKVGGYNG